MMIDATTSTIPLNTTDSTGEVFKVQGCDQNYGRYLPTISFSLASHLHPSKKVGMPQYSRIKI